MFQAAGIGGGGYGGLGGHGGGGAMSFGALGAGAGGVTPQSIRAGSGGAVSGEAVIPDMMNVYNQLLGMNVQNYNNILGAYGNAQNQLASGLAGSTQGFSDLYRGITQTLGVGGTGWGVALPGANAIEESFAKARGDIKSGMISQGLGNSTVAAALQNQQALHASRAFGELGANLANTAAGYAAQIGLAQQQQYMQGLGLQNQLANNYLNTLGQYRFANTAGDLVGRYSAASQGGGGYGGGGGFRGSGGSSGGSGMLGWGGLGATTLGWMGGGSGYLGHSGAYAPWGSLDGYGRGYGAGGYSSGGYLDAGSMTGADFYGSGFDLGGGTVYV
jgi:hypothetical protein